MIRPSAAAAALAVLALFSTSPAPVSAKILAFDLPGMLAVCDDAVHGTIVARRVFRIDHPIDGPELYYTVLSVNGASLRDGSEVGVEVTLLGGFVTPDEGVHNSESPREEETAIGAEVVLFHDWTENMGGDVAGHALVAGHGGLYTVQTNRRGDRVVLGRGPGYAVPLNVSLEALRTEVAKLESARRER